MTQHAELIAQLRYHAGQGIQTNLARMAQREAADALQAMERKPMTDAPVEVGWLIECRVDPTAPYWLTADNTNTNDANEALRFARKIDADGFLKVFLTAHFGDDTFGIYKRHFSPEKYSVTEHMFIDIKPKGEL